jgi:hypothetical protein
MTRKEQQLYLGRWQARKTGRITHFQSGFDSVFGGSPDDATVAPRQDADSRQSGDVRRIDTDDIGDPQFDGEVPRERADSDNDDITGAISQIQERIAALGNEDLLDLWASTAQALTKAVGLGGEIRKAKPNASGSTREPLHDYIKGQF